MALPNISRPLNANGIQADYYQNSKSQKKKVKLSGQYTWNNISNSSNAKTQKIKPSQLLS